MKKTINLELCAACEGLYREHKTAGKGLTDGSFCVSCTAKLVSQAKPVVKGFESDQLKTALQGLKFD